MIKLMNLKSYGLYPNQPFDSEIEYLESTGTQWIDTGVYVALNSTEIEVFAVLPNNFGSVFGIYDNNYNFYALSNTNHKIVLRFGSVSETVAYDNVNALHRIAFIGQKVYLDDTVIGTNTLTGTRTAHTMPLFIRWTGSYTYPSSGLKIYSCRIWDNGVLIHDFVPVRFTNELGVSEGAMYDRHGVGGINPDGSARNDGLYRNRGTGSFVRGPDKS